MPSEAYKRAAEIARERYVQDPFPVNWWKGLKENKKPVNLKAHGNLGKKHNREKPRRGRPPGMEKAELWNRKRNATPRWANKKAIAQVYAEAKKISLRTNILHEVDHIIPLNGKTVCGLHCEANLRIVNAMDNRKKSNREWPDMWD